MELGKSTGSQGTVNWSDLLPTGKCFDEALDCLWLLIKEDPRIADDGSHLLAHGICYNAFLDYGYSHAWIEKADTVLHTCVFRGQHGMAELPKDEFYRLLKITDFTLYTPRQAQDENHRSGHYGPWIERYRFLCKNKTTS